MLSRCHLSRVGYTLVLLHALVLSAPAQTIDDGIMMGRGELRTANLYSYDRWDQYWEGTLKRTNDNIGTITTRTNVLMANYGLTNRLNVIGMVPYVWTRASQGVLHGINGFQDLSLAAKWSAVERRISGGQFRAIGVVAAGLPMTDYNVELLPLSIGMGSRRVSGRGTAHLQFDRGWYLTGSGAVTWRSSVQLDRPYFYTDDQFVMSDEVEMPKVAEYMGGVGYMKGDFMTMASFGWQRMLGGGDIRRQDMPFVSNRMNALRVGGMVMYPLPKLAPFAAHFSLAHTLDGRNVGDATTIAAGLVYTFNRSTVQ